MNHDDHRTLPLGSICPQCGQVPTRSDGRCGDHGLYAIPPGELAHIRKAPLLGQLIEHRYALVGYIGSGGMGAIYRARQLGIDRDVAFKFMHAGQGAGATARERFKREARVVANLQSDHTVRVFDFGEIAEGQLRGALFMVMDLVEGISLARRLRIGPMPLDEIALLLAHVADSVDEAHAKGIVHRDLKPSNILLTSYHGQPRAKVIDFGIARVEDSDHTLHGTTLGTPSYMAPEMWPSDDPTPITGRVDVYAMGVVLYQMLTGVKPFRSRELLLLFDFHLNHPVPSLAGDDPILAQLEPVVMRAMEKNPDDRHGSLSELARDFSDRLAAAASHHDTESLSVPFQTPSGRAEITTRESRSGSTSLAMRGMLAPGNQDSAPPSRPALWGSLAAGSAATALITALAAGWIPLGAAPAPPSTDAGPPPPPDASPPVDATIDAAPEDATRDTAGPDARAHAIIAEAEPEPPRPRLSPTDTTPKKRPRPPRAEPRPDVPKKTPAAPDRPSATPTPTRGTLEKTFALDPHERAVRDALDDCACLEAKNAFQRLERSAPQRAEALRARVDHCHRRIDVKTGQCAK